MKRHFIYCFTLIVISLSVFTSCSDNETPTPVEPQPTEQEKEKPTEFKRIQLTLDQENTNYGANKFAYKMLRESVAQANVTNKTNNIFISPLGLCTVLTMLANGAEDQTLQEIANALGADLDKLNSFYSMLVETLPKADNQVVFSSANSFWTNNGFNPSQNYVDILKDNFDAESFIVDLNTVETMNAINQWCSDKTNGMIPKFLKNPLNDCKMFLANALYFNGKWSEPFDIEKTDKSVFTSANGNKSEVDMMHGEKMIEYERLSEGEMVTIFYGNRTYAFNIYLPSEGVSIEKALASSDKYLKPVLNGRGCKLALPKFEIEYENDEIADIAKNMGISRLFSIGSLSKIATELYVTFIKQVSKINVHETGAEAAAVTGAGMCDSAGDFTPQEPAVVNVDRPFIFSITETSNNIILFAGVVRKL